MKKAVFLIIFIQWLMIGCSPQARLSRLVAKHPELSTIDTIKTTDTLLIPGALVDTATVTRPADTFYIVRDRLDLKIIRSFDTIRVMGGCRPDTIIKPLTFYVPRIMVMPAKETTWKLFWRLFYNRLPWFAGLIFASLLFFIVIFRRFRR